MKLSIQLLVLFVFSLQYSHAQEGFRIGPKGSYFFSRANVTDTIPTNYSIRYKSGFNGGISMYYGFSKKFGIATNVLYTYKGYRVLNDTNPGGKTLKHNQSYIEVPVYMVFKQRFNKVSYIRENVGLSLASQLSGRKTELTNDNKSFRILEENKLTFYPMLHLGIEVSNESKIGNVMIFGMNYNYSFGNHTNIGIYNGKTSTIPYFNLGFKGGYIGVSLTYQFNLKNLKKEEEFFY